MANIPQRTLPIGIGFTPAIPIGAHTGVVIDLLRTVAGGLNSLDGTTSLTVVIQSSDDGSMWEDEGGITQPGGIIIGKHGQVNNFVVTVDRIPSSRNWCRVKTVVTGLVAVVVSGTATAF